MVRCHPIPLENLPTHNLKSFCHHPKTNLQKAQYIPLQIFKGLKSSMTMSPLNLCQTHCSTSTRSHFKSNFFKRKRFSGNQAPPPSFSLLTWACLPIRIIYWIRLRTSPWPSQSALFRDSSCPSWPCLYLQLKHLLVTKLSQRRTWTKWGAWQIAKTASWKLCSPTLTESQDRSENRSAGWVIAWRSVEFSLRKRISIF